MRAILFLIGGVVLANIVWATFFWRAPAQDKPAPIVNSATLRGQEPWMTNEHSMESSRQSTRKSMLATLGKPWSEFCTAEGRKRLIESINSYYWHRNTQLTGYGKTWGDAASRYIAKAWATPDDNRIERLTRETYGRGYFALDELRPFTRAALAEVVKGERVTGRPCAG